MTPSLPNIFEFSRVFAITLEFNRG